jgi:hypothetical protein
MKKILDTLKSSIADLSGWAEEKKSLEERRRKAQADIADASNEKITPPIEAKIGRASNIIAVCDARLSRLESGAASAADQVREIYLAARDAWNKLVAVRRELARAEFLTANIRFFDNDEKVTANRLAGILPLLLARLGRASWNGFFGGPNTPFDLLAEINCFIGHIQRHSQENGIPID